MSLYLKGLGIHVYLATIKDSYVNNSKYIEANCNTPFPEYVLSCVFRFLDRIFLIYLLLWIIYMIVLSWIWIRGLGVSPSLNRELDPRILLDLDILVIRFDQFQFQTSFSNILDFLWFSGIFCDLIENLQNRCRPVSLTDSRIFNLQTVGNF